MGDLITVSGRTLSQSGQSPATLTYTITETDIDALKKGYVSVTPIKLDLTDYNFINFLEKDFLKIKEHA